MIINQMNDSSRWFYRILCLNWSVKLIEIVVMGTEKQILTNAPLYRAKNPSFLYIENNPWKTFRYPKTDFSREPPCVATSALWTCILSLTRSSGVTIKPAKAEAEAEHIILSLMVGFSRSFKTKSFIFYRVMKNIALNGPKKTNVAP